jgi:hypothetical protein
MDAQAEKSEADEELGSPGSSGTLESLLRIPSLLFREL